MFEPIGVVQNNAPEKVDHSWGEVVSHLALRDDLADGLTGLEAFSHILVVYHLSEAKFIPEKHLIRRPQGREDMPMVGIFAQRAKDRPNPIGITAVRLLGVEGNTATVQGLDAIDGTPVLDIKPYYPIYDRKDDATVPAWVDVLMGEYF